MRPDLPILLALLAAPALAEGQGGQGEGGQGAGGLWGRTVLFRVETWNDPAAPLLQSRDYVGSVGPGPEFGVAFEGSFGFGVVPVQVDLGAARIDLSYEGLAPGFFAEAAFNGYVLTFPAECALVMGAAVDPTATTLPLTPENLILEPRALRLDVGGLAYDKDSRIGITLDVTDCVLS